MSGIKPMITSQKISPHYDVVIVGARCAGAATAMLLARAGAKVLLIDRQGYGTDTLSTHALMRGAIIQLNRWNILPKLIAAGTPAIKKTNFHYGDEDVRIAIKPGHGVDALYAPRRNVLDRILVDAAREAGAEVHHGIALTGLVKSKASRVEGVILRREAGSTFVVKAEFIIGADGCRSTVASLAAAQKYKIAKTCSASVYGHFAGLEDDGYHWFYRPGTSAGIIPTNDGKHCVFVAVPPAKFAETFRGNTGKGFLKTLYANSPGYAERIEAGELENGLRPFVGVPGFFRQSYGDGWALVGDAGYFKDPLTAHGITDALRDAEALSVAIMKGNQTALARYQEARDALSMPLFDVTDKIAALTWNLDEIKNHHVHLNKAMKQENDHVAAFSPPTSLAA